MEMVSLALLAWLVGSSLGGTQMPYEIVDGRLVRVEAGVRRELPSTSTNGCGRVHAFDRSPLGNVYVAAENGLFVTHDRVASLDALDLWQGAPLGPAVGLVVDSPTRLWVATRESFGAVELRQHFGTTFAETDGAPAPPYLSLERDGDGALVLTTERGEWRYLPERAGAPTLELVSLDGRAPAENELVLASGAQEFEVELRGSGAGTLSYRWRDARRLGWTLLAGARARVADLEPGRHELHFGVWDRDLRVATVGPVVVEVPYPRWLDKKRVFLLAILAAAGITSVFWLRARASSAAGRWSRAAVSSVIATVLLAQLVAALVPHARGWPFVGFGMYTEVARPFSHAYRDELVGVGLDGERFEIDLYTAGVGQFVVRRMVAPAVCGGERERRRLLDELNRSRFGGALRGFEFRCRRHRLTEHGPIEVAPLEYVRYVEEEPDGPR